MLNRITLLIVLALSTTGCAKLLKRTPPDTTKFEPSDVEMHLEEIASSIQESLHTLAMQHKVDDPPVINTAPLVTPEGGMGGTADINWTGPIAPLLNKIAKITDYRLKILGSEPATPIMINIASKDTVIADIVKNASYQAKAKANVMVYPESRVIELRYNGM